MARLALAFLLLHLGASVQLHLGAENTGTLPAEIFEDGAHIEASEAALDGFKGWTELGRWCPSRYGQRISPEAELAQACKADSNCKGIWWVGTWNAGMKCADIQFESTDNTDQQCAEKQTHFVVSSSQSLAKEGAVTTSSVQAEASKAALDGFKGWTEWGQWCPSRYGNRISPEAELAQACKADNDCKGIWWVSDWNAGMKCADTQFERTDNTDQQCAEKQTHFVVSPSQSLAKEGAETTSKGEFWRVAWEGGVRVRVEADLNSPSVAVKKYGEVLRGSEHDGWLKLGDSPGFMKVKNDDTNEHWLVKFQGAAEMPGL